jgi:type I restriction enzyme R subunit
MIKHAAKEDEELLTAEERVTRAINKLRTEIQFNEEQEQWLELIKNHLVENLTIDADDFDTLPVFARKGGIGRAKKVFDSIFDKVISKLNELIAA